MAEENFEVPEEGGRKGRGPDIEWFNSESFKDGKEYNESVFKRHLDEQMSKKSTYNKEWARFEVYICKVSKRKSYKSPS